MAAKTAWITGTELVTFIGTIPNAVSPSSSDCDDIIGGVVRDFEQRTGRIPFLCSGSFTSETFDPPDNRDRRLSLDIQVVAIQSVTIGVTPNSTGTALVAGQDYILKDVNAIAKGVPYERLWFLTAPGCYPQSVVIVAKYGFGTVIPYDAWEAVKYAAAAQGIIQGYGAFGAPKVVQQGTVRREFGIQGVRTIVEAFNQTYEDAVSKYTYVASH